MQKRKKMDKLRRGPGKPTYYLLLLYIVLILLTVKEDHAVSVLRIALWIAMFGLHKWTKHKQNWCDRVK